MIFSSRFQRRLFGFAIFDDFDVAEAGADVPIDDVVTDVDVEADGAIVSDGKKVGAVDT